MGELLLSNLEYKSFSDFASDLLGPWAGYFTGWTYWFCWVVTGMADVVAITAYAQFWFPGLSDWVASLAVIVLLLSLNLATVKMFGEMEFWFAMIKIVAIVGLIVVGLVMVLTHFQSPTGVQASFTHLWNDGGWFPKGSAASLPASRLRCLRLWVLSWWVPPLRKPKIRRNPCRAPSTPFRFVSSCSTSSRWSSLCP
jgi:L-asparagine transporter-like permease